MVEDFADCLELEAAGEGTWRGRSLREIGEGDVVFGGQMAAQLLVAGATVDPAKTVKSLQVLFGRAAVRSDPVTFGVEPLQGGRTFASATVTAAQHGVVCARALVLLSAGEPDLVRHDAPMPQVPPPDECPNWDAYTVGSERTWVGGRLLRVVGGVDTSDPEGVHEPRLCVWTRGRRLGADPVRHQAYVAFATAGPNIGVAMLPHRGLGTVEAHRTVSTGIMAHDVVFHDRLDAEAWLLMAFESPSAAGGRSFGRGDVFAEDGRLVASFTQSNMIRPMGARPAGGGRTTL
jgi:acyl-CoA thioesterase